MKVDEIKQKIEEEISKITQLIKDYKEQSKPVTLDNSIGRISRMDAINNKSIPNPRFARLRPNYLSYIRQWTTSKSLILESVSNAINPFHSVEFCSCQRVTDV